MHGPEEEEDEPELLVLPSDCDNSNGDAHGWMRVLFGVLSGLTSDGAGFTSNGARLDGGRGHDDS